MRGSAFARICTTCLLGVVLPSVALAEPVTDLGGGVLIVHRPPDLILSDQDPPPGGWCIYAEIADCASQANDCRPLGGWPDIWFILAGFVEESEWCGVEFGIEYNGIELMGASPCVLSQVLEIQSPGWPMSGSGTAIAKIGDPWVGTLVPIYYFWGYSYYAPGGVFALGENPYTPGPVAFANCDGEEFPAGCYGAIGFGEFQGIDCCPPAASVPEPEIAPPQGDEPSTWGALKRLYQ